MNFIRISAIILLAGVNLSSLRNYYFNDNFAKGAWDKVCSYIVENVEKGDVIFFPSFIPAPFIYYYKGRLPVESIDKSNCLEKAGQYKSFFLISYLEKFSDPDKMIYNQLKSMFETNMGEKRYSDTTIYNFVKMDK